jgi:hypothetical protein
MVDETRRFDQLTADLKIQPYDTGHQKPVPSDGGWTTIVAGVVRGPAGEQVLQARRIRGSKSSTSTRFAVRSDLRH